MSGPEIKVAKVSDHLHARQHLAQSLQECFSIKCNRKYKKMVPGFFFKSLFIF